MYRHCWFEDCILNTGNTEQLLKGALKNSDSIARPELPFIGIHSRLETFHYQDAFSIHE